MGEGEAGSWEETNASEKGKYNTRLIGNTQADLCKHLDN